MCVSAKSTNLRCNKDKIELIYLQPLKLETPPCLHEDKMVTHLNEHLKLHNRDGATS